MNRIECTCSQGGSAATCDACAIQREIARANVATWLEGNATFDDALQNAIDTAAERGVDQSGAAYEFKSLAAQRRGLAQ
jgi:hypothetical protein